MRTRRGWLGFAARWAPTGRQEDVEEPTTVLVVGEDETDEALLQIAEAGHVGGAFDTIGFRPNRDVFVLGIMGRAAGPVVMQGLVEDAPLSVLTLASLLTYLRSPTAAPVTADFVVRVGLVGPAIHTVTVPPVWLLFPRPGLLVRAGTILWVTLLGGGPPVPNFGVMWRAS